MKISLTDVALEEKQKCISVMNECAPCIPDNRKLAAPGVNGAGGGDSEPGISGSGLAGCCLSAVVSHGLPLSPVRFVSYGGFHKRGRPSRTSHENESLSEYIAGVPRRLLNNIPLFIESVKWTSRGNSRGSVEQQDLNRNVEPNSFVL